MSKKNKHRKHTKLPLANYGQFGRNEWAILGTPCGEIKKLAYRLTEALSEKWKVAYVDADHKSADEESEKGSESRSARAYGAAMEYTDKINFHRFDSGVNFNTYQYRSWFNEMDVVLVNGNHYKAKHQIVVIDPRKEDSLRRKLDRLTDVHLFLLSEGVSEIPGFLKDHISDFARIPVFQINDYQSIINFLSQGLEKSRPPLYGLTLTGGKSLRMGHDKGLLDYHGKPQREYVFELLSDFCDKTFLSCRPDQKTEMGEIGPVLEDTFSGLGPFGGILSGFREYPDCAWLVIACDLPLLDKATIRFLIENRNPSAVATAYNSPVTQFPEPLIAIWEPKSYPVLLHFLAQGYSCPRKVLINSDVSLMDAPNPQALRNVNTPEEHEEIMRLLVKT